MGELVGSRPFSLTPASRVLQSPTVTLDPLTSEIRVRIQRPTTLAPLAWAANAELKVSVVLIINGVESEYTSNPRGGILLHPDGSEAAFFQMKIYPTVLFGERARTYLQTATRDEEGLYHDVPLTRIGEVASSFQAYLKLERITGSITSVIEAAVTSEAPAPKLERHKNSVAFDAHTASEDLDGGTTHSLSHTASGSDRVAHVNVGIYHATATLSSVTYGGAATDGSAWDASNGSHKTYGRYKLAPATSSQSVVSTASATPSAHYLSVVSMTGVNQTTPVRTANTDTGTSTSSSVNVGSVGGDDMTVSAIHIDTFASGLTSSNATVMANITGSSFGDTFGSARRAGNGTITLSWTGSKSYAHGGNAYIAAAAGGGAKKRILAGLLAQRALRV